MQVNKIFVFQIIFSFLGLINALKITNISFKNSIEEISTLSIDEFEHIFLQEFSEILTKLDKDKLIDCKMNNITKEIFNENQTYFKNIFTNYFNSLIIKSLSNRIVDNTYNFDNSSEINETIININVFDFNLSYPDLYLYIESDNELPNDFNLKINVSFNFRIIENMTSLRVNEEFSLKSIKKYKYENGTIEFYFDLNESISKIKSDYKNKIDFYVPYFIFIKDIFEDSILDDKIYNIIFSEDIYQLIENNEKDEIIYNNIIKTNNYSGVTIKIMIIISIILLITIVILIIIIVFCIKKKQDKNNKNQTNTSKINNSNTIINTSNFSENQFGNQFYISNLIEHEPLEKMKNPIIILFKIDKKDKLYIIDESNTSIEKLIKFYSSIKKYNPKEIKFSIDKEIISHDRKNSLKDIFIKNTNNSQINIIKVEIPSKLKYAKYLNNIIKIAKIAFKLLKFFSEIACLVCIIFICALSSNDPFEDQLIKFEKNIDYFLYAPDLSNGDIPTRCNYLYMNKYKLEYEENITDDTEHEDGYIDFEALASSNYTE